MPIEQLFAKQEKILTYIKQDDELARKLYNSKGDLNLIKNELKSKSLDPFIENILDATQYDSFTLSMSDKIIERHSNVVEEIKLKQLGLKIPVKKKRTYKDYNKIYKRKKRVGYNKFSSTEIIFLRSRLDDKPKQTIEEFYTFFGIGRSTSSITNKIRRLKRE